MVATRVTNRITNTSPNRRRESVASERQALRDLARHDVLLAKPRQERLAAEILERLRRALRARERERLGLPLAAHCERRGGGEPGVDGEQPVLLPGGAGGEVDAVRSERAAVAVEPRLLVRAAQLGRDGVAEHVGDVAQAGRD